MLLYPKHTVKPFKKCFGDLPPTYDAFARALYRDLCNLKFVPIVKHSFRNPKPPAKNPLFQAGKPLIKLVFWPAFLEKDGIENGHCLRLYFNP